jgi:predicted lipid-binding transport protein (Tim44 family)
MMRKLCIFTISIFFLAFLLDGLAEAGRMGGGKSFGSKPSYQRSAPAPTPQRDARQTQSQPQQGVGRPGGLFGGFGGMLGGMLMGGLLGSLLFGGMRGWGGPGLLDILIIGGGLFLLFRYLRARRAATQSAGPMAFESGGYQSVEREPVGSPWGGMSAQRDEERAPKIPAGFDVEEFLKGARAAYNRLQDSWNKRDLEDIRQFTSPEVWEELKRQAKEDPSGGKTEIVLVKSQLLEVNTTGGEAVASVYFDVLMRENPDEERPKQVRELWHFSKADGVKDSFWRLEGIQQLED